MGVVVIACGISNGILMNGVKINGTAWHKGSAEPRPFKMAGAYALTEEVDEEVWKKWSESNKDSDMLLRNMIFACPNVISARIKARQLQGSQNQMPQGFKTSG